MPEATLKQIIDFFGMSMSQFSKEWKQMPEADRKQIKGHIQQASRLRERQNTPPKTRRRAGRSRPHQCFRPACAGHRHTEQRVKSWQIVVHYSRRYQDR
jgi:hypothetical protein